MAQWMIRDGTDRRWQMTDRLMRMGADPDLLALFALATE